MRHVAPRGVGLAVRDPEQHVGHQAEHDEAVQALQAQGLSITDHP
jgi:hypothetical protein